MRFAALVCCFAFALCGCGVTDEPSRPAEVTEDERIAKGLSPGQDVRLTNERVGGHVGEPIWVFPTIADNEAAQKAVQAKDEVGLRLVPHFVVPDGTRARVLESDYLSLRVQVRIIDGQHRGKAGVVPAGQVEP